MDKFNLSIITPEKKLFEGKAQEVFVPGEEGGMRILSHHAPLLAGLNKGKIIIKADNSQKEFEIQSGIIELHNDQLTIFAR